MGDFDGTAPLEPLEEQSAMELDELARQCEEKFHKSFRDADAPLSPIKQAMAIVGQRDFLKPTNDADAVCVDDNVVATGSSSIRGHEIETFDEAKPQVESGGVKAAAAEVTFGSSKPTAEIACDKVIESTAGPSCTNPKDQVPEKRANSEKHSNAVISSVESLGSLSSNANYSSAETVKTSEARQENVCVSAASNQKDCKASSSRQP